MYHAGARMVHSFALLYCKTCSDAPIFVARNFELHDVEKTYDSRVVSLVNDFVGVIVFIHRLVSMKKISGHLLRTDQPKCNQSAHARMQHTYAHMHRGREREREGKVYT